VTAFSTAHRDHCVASGALCRSHLTEPDITPSPRHAARPSLHRRFVKNGEFGRARTPSIDECCLLRFGLRRAGPPRLACASPGRTARNHRQPGTGPECFHHGDRLPAPFHHPSTRLDGQTQANSWQACGSPRMEHLDRTPLVESCNQNSPRAQPWDRPNPGASARHGASSLRWTWRSLLKGLGPLPPHRPPTPGDAGTSSSPQTFRLRDGSVRRQPRFHEPGAGRLSPPDSSRHPLVADNGASPRLDPLGHLSSRDHGGTGRRTRGRALLSLSQATHLL
jgi:hypothetical protein